MFQPITPCFWFENQAEEAARFYVSIFPDSRILTVTPGPSGQVLVVEFSLRGHVYIALNGGPPRGFTEALSLSINCEGQAEIDYYWEKLSTGGQPSQCGWLRDRYGVSWQVVPTALPRLLQNPDRDRASRAFQAMLKMSKLDLATLEAAAAGVH